MVRALAAAVLRDSVESELLSGCCSGSNFVLVMESNAASQLNRESRICIVNRRGGRKRLFSVELATKLWDLHLLHMS